MAGHSKWANIKHRKGAQDAKRGKLFTKLIREITVAARMGGGDPEANPRLRTAVAQAKSASMPKDNIDRAIKKGTGELEGASIEEVVYEGYGPGGVALMIEAMTDNRNRTVADIRHLLDKHSGSLGQTNSVSWMFTRKGRIEVPGDGVDEDRITEAAIEAGAEDIRGEDGTWVVTTEDNELHDVREQLESLGLPIAGAHQAMIPQSTVTVSGKDAERLLKLLDALDDYDDVQQVHSNFDIDEAEMERLSA